MPMSERFPLAPELIVVVPSRGRPGQAVELAKAFVDTCRAETLLLFAVDESDPEAEEYGKACQVVRLWPPSNVRVNVIHCPSKTMVEALNMAAMDAVKRDDVFAIGFMGDDHRPRTIGWDSLYLQALSAMKTGIVYGNDLYQGRNLPTQCAMTADIIKTLGFMAPPVLRHMYVDNFWRDLGMNVGCLTYLPEVIVEHMHPAAGKAELDEGYERVNDPQVYSDDLNAYVEYHDTQGITDRENIKALRFFSRGPDRMELSLDPEFHPDPRLGFAGMVEAQPRHEWRLFEEGTIPEYTTPEWYLSREHAPHLEQPVHRDRLMQTASFVAQAAFSTGCNTLVDLGAGDGGLLSLLGPRLTAWGYDLMPSNLEAAKARGVDVRHGDVVAGDIEWGQIAVCTEMLEHLVDPHAFVRQISEHCQALVCSSPAMERPGNAYEFHTWAWDLDGYRALVEQGGFRLLRQRMVHSFQVLLAVRA